MKPCILLQGTSAIHGRRTKRHCGITYYVQWSRQRWQYCSRTFSMCFLWF